MHRRISARLLATVTILLVAAVLLVGRIQGAPGAVELGSLAVPEAPSGPAVAGGSEEAVAAAPGMDDTDESLRVTELEVVQQVTGPHSPNRTDERWGVVGTDLGHSFLHRGQLYMAFGDTYGGGAFFRPGGPGAADWRSNTMARIENPDPRGGIRFSEMIAGPDGRARELLGSLKVDGVEKTVIPTNGISDGARMFLHYMSVRTWQNAGEWDVGRAGIAFSDDDGRTWTKSPDAVRTDPQGFAQVAYADGPSDDVYVFGIPAGRFGGVSLARVSRDALLRPGEYSYWDGGAWAPDETDAETIVPAPVGELSVRYSEAHGRWLMLTLDEERDAVVLRTASHPVGPWSDARVVMTSAEAPTLYAPYLLPAETGQDVYFTLSRYDAYNVQLVRARLGSGV